MQKITEAPLSSCPFCAGRVKKLVSNCSFQLKGTGWYVTDYGSGNKTESGDGTGKEKKGEKKEEKKEATAEKGTDTGTAKEKAVNQ